MIQSNLSEEEKTHSFLQWLSATLLIAATHLSTIANRKSPIQVPIIAPVLIGTHPLNQIVSPGVKCRYEAMPFPVAREVLPSILMSTSSLRLYAPTKTSLKRKELAMAKNFMLATIGLKRQEKIGGARTEKPGQRNGPITWENSDKNQMLPDFATSRQRSQDDAAQTKFPSHSSRSERSVRSSDLRQRRGGRN